MKHFTAAVLSVVLVLSLALGAIAAPLATAHKSRKVRHHKAATAKHTPKTTSHRLTTTSYKPASATAHKATGTHKTTARRHHRRRLHHRTTSKTTAARATTTRSRLAHKPATVAKPVKHIVHKPVHRTTSNT